MTNGCAKKTSDITSAEKLKSLFAQGKNLGTQLVRTVHVLKKVIIVIVTPTIKVECATPAIYTQLCHSCWQR